MPKIVGIDLGTTNSVIAVMEGAEPVVISLAEGTRLCPSVVGFTRTGERLVGPLAKRQALAAPERTIRSIKRQMGTDYTVEIDNRRLTPQEISALILQKLKADAESYLGEPVVKAVITVPAYFSDAQRQATKDAGTIAGLDVVRILNEPTAAALAYGANQADVQNVLVWDLGGGTFDVSLLEAGDGLFHVRATNGDTELGGDDWDSRLMEWLADQFAKFDKPECARGSRRHAAIEGSGGKSQNRTQRVDADKHQSALFIRWRGRPAASGHRPYAGADGKTLFRPAGSFNRAVQAGACRRQNAGQRY